MIRACFVPAKSQEGEQRKSQACRSANGDCGQTRLVAVHNRHKPRFYAHFPALITALQNAILAQNPLVIDFCKDPSVLAREPLGKGEMFSPLAKRGISAVSSLVLFPNWSCVYALGRPVADPDFQRVRQPDQAGFRWIASC